MQRYKRYDRIPLNEIFNNNIIGSGTTFPSSGTALYNVSVTPTSGNNLNGRNWTLSAVPISSARMKNDGKLTLNYQGIKCRAEVCGTAEEWQ